LLHDKNPVKPFQSNQSDDTAAAAPRLNLSNIKTGPSWFPAPSTDPFGIQPFDPNADYGQSPEPKPAKPESNGFGNLNFMSSLWTKNSNVPQPDITDNTHAVAPAPGDALATDDIGLGFDKSPYSINSSLFDHAATAAAADRAAEYTRGRTASPLVKALQSPTVAEQKFIEDLNKNVVQDDVIKDDVWWKSLDKENQEDYSTLTLNNKKDLFKTWAISNGYEYKKKNNLQGEWIKALNNNKTGGRRTRRTRRRRRSSTRRRHRARRHRRTRK
jgi:hypothetical protein